MPSISVVFYQEKEGGSPVVEWLIKLNETHPKAYDKCRAALARSALLGHELRRPEVDYLCDGISKEASVPAADINHAIARKTAFTANPIIHTFKGEIYDA